VNERGAYVGRRCPTIERILPIVRTVVYIAIALILIIFGYLALFSIGWPFALTGILMLALIRDRARLDVLAPALVWPWFFTLGYLLVAPIGCTGSVSAPSGAKVVEGSTRCNALFLTYAGGPHYEPPLLPAILTGAMLATGASLAIGWALRRRRPADRPSIRKEPNR
jgi:hypothetical protein